MKTMQGIRSLMPSLSALAAALVLAGCASAPPTVAEHAGIAVPASFSAQAAAAGWTQAAPAEAQPRGAWWLVFADTELSALVERAGEANTDVQTAAARLAEARALLRSADAQRQPQIATGGGAARQAGVNTANGMQPATLVTAGLNFSYEADLFGRLSRASEAAREDANAREALLQSTRLMVQADVAQTYLQLRSLQTERQLVEQSLAAYRETLTLIEKRYRAGDAAELDVARMQTEVSATEAETLALERQQAALTHALAVLVGDVASGFSLASQPQAATLPVIPAGVPATVLARRPDVSAAQASVLAAQARVGVAQAAWFPAITLTGNGGYASPELGDLFKWSARSWGIGALLSLPIFDGGRNRAGVQVAEANQRIAIAQYEKAVQTAFREAADVLADRAQWDERLAAQTSMVAATQKAFDLSEARFKAGVDNYLTVLDAQRSLYTAQQTLIGLRLSEQLNRVTLWKVLGGEQVQASSASAPANS